MGHSSDATLPSPLPAPLSDPLREFRPLILVLAVGSVVFAAREAANQKYSFSQTIYSPYLWCAYALGLGASFALFIILPRRPTKAIYLRSFRNDPMTGKLRTVVQATLGSRFRLSGIRDPRRRLSQTSRYFLTGIFLARYCIPKYMNLEAGPDWKARLWRSLGDADCADRRERIDALRHRGGLPSLLMSRSGADTRRVRQTPRH